MSFLDKFKKDSEEFRKKKFGESIEDAYDVSEKRMSASEAKRDSVYELPPVAQQILECYMTQMKIFTRQKTLWLLVVLLILMPVVAFIYKFSTGSFCDENVVNIAMSSSLVLLPLMIALICSITCGSMLPQEFNERTVYLSLPLPMNRSVFYIGKFLAGFSLCAGVVIAAYGLSILIAMTECEVAYTGPMFVSLILSITSVLLFSAFAYFISATSKRGGSMKPFLILFAGLPLIGVGLAAGSAYYGWGIEGVLNYLPCYAPDLALALLGEPIIGGAPAPIISVHGLFTMMGLTTSPLVPLPLNVSTVAMVLINLVLSVVFLVAGNYLVQRRDM